MAKTDFKSVDEYIAAQPEAARGILECVRNTIRDAVPDAEESISYQIPAYSLQGSPVLYFAGWKRHYSLYPAGQRLIDAFKEELSPYKIEKSTIRFPLTDAVPAELIGRIAKFRGKELAGGNPARHRTSKKR